jgi:hypothetical protein
MITGMDLFTNREIRSSSFFQFLNNERIHILWQQIDKLIAKRRIRLSVEFKRFVNKLLLNEYANFEEIRGELNER